MEIDFDKGVDSLLRRDAGARGRERAQSEVLTQDENHLDADELNAYAENALPVVTRAAYTAHLADCDRCRKTVTAILLAAPTIAQIAEVSSEASARAAITEDSTPPVTTTPEARESSGWLERLRAIFAPTVLIYAVPALVLLFVGVAAFVALRTDRDGEQQLTAARQAEPTVEQMVATNSNSNAATTSSSEANSTVSNMNTSSANMANSNMMNSNAGAIGSNAANVSPSASSAPATDQRAGNASPNFAPPPPTSSTAPQTFSTPLENRANNLPRGQTTDDDGITARTQNAPPNARAGNMNAGPMPQQQQSPPINERAARDESARLSTEAPPSPASRSTTGGRGRAASRPTGSQARIEGADNERADGDGSTRTVAGRTFRRQGGAWIDTAYRPGAATVNVRRGSEQFRALAADEPIISTIAAQFGGEVIVVVRGRAYRIR